MEQRALLASKEARLRVLREEAVPEILALLDGETDEIAIMASVSCVLYSRMQQTNWAGFYRCSSSSGGDEVLTVGPYQGDQVGCLRIALSRGVCGKAASTRTTQLVPDVHAFPGHIACDSASQSELVVPVLDKGGRLIGVLDLDSPFLDGFCEGEARELERMLGKLFE